MSHADVHADATRVLSGWRPATHDQESLRQAYLAYLAAEPQATARPCAAGHLTASALVLDATGEQVLLTLHPRVGRWLQLGGHVEPEDSSLAGAALREATEESGIAGLLIDPEPVRLDVHPITCSGGVPTRHLDVQFQIIAPPSASAVRSHESDDLRFWPISGLPELDDSVLALIAQVRTAGSGRSRELRSVEPPAAEVGPTSSWSG